jgi:hypothetical protein
MALQSKLFKGDRALEACLVRDASHVTQGAVGDHVSKIQMALITLDNVRIDVADLSGKKYGPSTADAVLAYKRKRNIVNYSYQTQADNIVGKMTIAQLDKEMLARETYSGGWCFFGPDKIGGGGTDSGVRQGFALTGAPGIGAPATSPKDQAKTHKVDAAQWAAAATQKLGFVAGVRASGDPEALKNLPNSTAWRGLETHFHISTASNQDSLISFLAKIFSFIEIAISRADDLFVDDLVKDDFAYAYLGGFNMDKTQMTGQIHFCQRYLKLGPLMQTAVIVHECAHYADGTIDHLASELPAPDGWPVNGVLAGHTANSKKYSQLNADEAKQNAYSYAQYALHMKMGFDKRLKYTKPPHESSD